MPGEVRHHVGHCLNNHTALRSNARILVLCTFWLPLCILSCSDSNTQPGPEAEEAILADNVVLLDETGLVIESLADSVLTLTYTETPPDIEPGDILYSGAGAGLLCGVTSVEIVGTRMRVIVVPAWLPEMFHECDIDEEFKIASIDQPVDISLETAVGAVDLTFGAVGSLSVTETVRFRLRVHDSVLELAMLEGTGVCSLDLDVIAEASAGIRWSPVDGTLAEIDLGTYPVPVPIPGGFIEVPVTVLVVIPYDVWIEAEAGIRATYPVSLRAELRLGAKYDIDSGGCSPIFKPGFSADGGPVTASTEVDLSAGAEITPGISFQVCRVTPDFCALRADLFLRPYVEGTLEIDPLCWEVNGGINAGVFFQVLKIVTLKLPQLEGPIFTLGNCVSDTTFYFSGHSEATGVVACQYAITMDCDIEYDFGGFRTYSVNTMKVVMDIDYDFDFVTDVPPVAGSAHVVLSSRDFDLDFDHTTVQYLPRDAVSNTIGDDWFNVAIDLARDKTFALGDGSQLAFIKGGETSHDFYFGTLPEPPHEEFGYFYADLTIPSVDYEFWMPWTFGYLFLQATSPEHPKADGPPSPSPSRE